MKKLTIKAWMYAFIFGALFCLTASGTCWADDDDTLDDETPSLTSQAQIDRADNLSQASARQAEAEYDKAQSALDSIDPAEDPDAYTEAQARLEAAEAKLGGVSAAEISAMREDGMGWGQIAHSLGVHPGNLGLGHSKAKERNQFSRATARDLKGGLAVGHGSTGVGSKGGSKGNNSEKGASGSKNSGKGSGKGGKGGNSGGNGGGKGKN